MCQQNAFGNMVQSQTPSAVAEALGGGVKMAPQCATAQHAASTQQEGPLCWPSRILTRSLVRNNDQNMVDLVLSYLLRWLACSVVDGVDIAAIGQGATIDQLLELILCPYKVLTICARCCNEGQVEVPPT